MNKILQLCAITFNILFSALSINFAFIAPFALSHAIQLNSVIEVPSSVYKTSQNSEFDVENIRGISGQDNLVTIYLPKDWKPVDTKKAWVRILGLPNALSFSNGKKVNNVHFMSLKDISQLALKSPEGYKGKFSLQFFLMEADKSVVSIIGKKTVQVELIALGTQKVNDKQVFSTSSIAQKDPILQQPQQIQPKQIESQAKNTQLKISKEEENEVMARARKYLKDGDIAAARLLYEVTALKGSAKAAYGIAQTFDPKFLERFVIDGLKPDIEQAKQWYKKAIELGSAEAKYRLSNLARGQ